MAVKFGSSDKGKVNGVPAFMKTGATAKKAQQVEKKRIQEKMDQVWRFWIPDETDTQITFLDGNLDEDGMLDCPMWYEHNLQIAGKWGNFFTCVKEEEVCPICDQEDSSLVAGFTVIDHSSYDSKKLGKVIKDTIKLFVCKQETFKLLQKLASKRNGLAGCTFDVSRTGAMSPNVGSMFDFIEKRTLKVLQKKYGSFKKGEEKAIEPLDFGKVIQYRTADELRTMGFGVQPIGTESNYDSEL